MMIRPVALLALALSASIANAQPTPPPTPAPGTPPSPQQPPAPTPEEQKRAQAKTLYERGLSAYNLGNFDEAIKAFSEAYAISQAPGLLFNIAQSHRLKKDYERAMFFYTTYLRLKPDAPNRVDVEELIKEMNNNLEAQKNIDRKPPEGVLNPDGQQTGTPTTGTTGTPTTGPTPTGNQTTADGPVIVATQTTPPPTLLAARMTAGIALLKSGDLDIPVQPSIGIVGGYPIAVGPMTLELGAGLAWTPLPYRSSIDDSQQRGRMLGVRAVVGAAYPVAPKINLRGELGLGLISLGGLAAGNPIADMRQAESFTLPSFRFGVAAEYVFAPNLAAYVSPFGIAYSPGNDKMYGGGLREINLLVGVGYRQ